VSFLENLRNPPQSIESEQSVLGGLMLSPKSLPLICDWLTEGDFYRRDHRLIYRGICAVIEQGGAPDFVTVGEWAEANGHIEEIPPSYLVDLSSNTPSAANIVAYAEIVREKSKLRELISAGTDLVNAGFQPEGRSAGEIVATTTHALSQLRTDTQAGGLLLASDALKDWYTDLSERCKHGAGVTGIPYPWHEVNKVTHGLQPGELTIIAARPSMGKSVMGLGLAMFSALREVHTAFFSLEMTTRQVNRRCVSNLAAVPHDWLLAPREEDELEWTRVSSAVSRLQKASLLVDESAGLRIEQIVARARRAHMRKPVGLIVVDHLHELSFKADTVRLEVGHAVGELKALGKEFGCPVVVLAPPDRGRESRPNKRPMMADLRESGEIEQKADVIWFLYREDYYRRNETGYQPQGDVELILGKGRDLRVSKPIVLREQFEFMRLADWDGPPPMRDELKPQTRGLS